MMTLISITFGYGWSMPILFLFAFVVLLSQYILDKLLIVYYYSYHYEFDD